MNDPRQRLILECAARLFCHYGQSKTTMADIAREAKIGVGTVYLVFPSKEAILEHLSSSAHMRVISAMKKVAEERARYGLVERLGGVLEARTVTFQMLATEGQHARELVHGTAAAVQAVRSRFRQEEHALLVTMLDEARDRGELAELDAARTASLLQRAFATLSPPVLFEQPSDEARRVAYEMSRLLLHGMLLREAPTPRQKTARRAARR